MSQPTIEHVYAAIDALYHTQQVEGTEAASKWLDEFQRSVRQPVYCLQIPVLSTDL